MKFVALIILDRFFIVFHTCIIAFNLFGWIWRRTRFANLVALSCTLLSWSVLGIWHGFGYCPFTEWHWKVRTALGDGDLPYSYIKFLVDTLTGWNVNPGFVDAAAVVLLLFSLSASAATNILWWSKRRK